MNPTTEQKYMNKIKKLEERVSELERMRLDITGMDAWALVSPILAKYTDGIHFTELDEAYVKVFCALKYWDENHEKEKKK